MLHRSLSMAKSSSATSMPQEGCGLRRALRPLLEVLACERGTGLVGYSSLALLVAIAVLTLLTRADTPGAALQHRPATTTSTD
jgi:hypothetical protein